MSTEDTDDITVRALAAGLPSLAFGRTTRGLDTDYLYRLTYDPHRGWIWITRHVRYACAHPGASKKMRALLPPPNKCGAEEAPLTQEQWKNAMELVCLSILHGLV